MNHTNQGEEQDDKTPLRAVIYCRCASATVGSPGASVVAQEARCRAYATEKGYQVDLVVKDVGVSGARFDRPGTNEILRFLNAAERGIRYVVLADSPNAIARSVEAFHKLYAAISEAGAGLEYPASGIHRGVVDRSAASVRSNGSGPQSRKGPSR